MTSNKILFVDDDEKILRAIERQFEDTFDLEFAVGPLEGLKTFEDNGPFAVVISDMRMPDMTGIEMLSKIKQDSPDTVRMLLTGFADLQTTIDAINKGNIFRFLSKPCSNGDLELAIRDGIRQYSLVRAEKELLEGTLMGSVKVLSDVLGLVNPLAFGQSTRVKATVDGILQRIQVADQWQLEIAAMLSALGCVTLPSELLEKKLSGQNLCDDELEVFSEHPAIAGDLIRSIPRLDKVADIIAGQQRCSKSSGVNETLEARVLQLALDFDMIELNAESSLHALSELKKNSDQYGHDLVEALSDYVKTERNFQFVELMIDDLRDGMVLAQNLENANGTLLMSHGQEITPSARRLLKNFSRNNSIEGPIKVVAINQANQLVAQ